MPASTNQARLPLALIVGGCLAADAVLGTPFAQQAGVPGEAAATMIAGKTTEIALPLKDSGFSLGDVAVRLGTDGSIKVHRAQLTSALTRIIRRDALEAIGKAFPEADYVSLDQITGAGLPCSYDGERLEIRVEPRVEQRPRGEITGSLRGAQIASENLAKPSEVSGYLNARASAAYNRTGGSDHSIVDVPALALEGAVRIHDMVIEGEADTTWDGKTIRRGTRAIYDMPDDAIRVRVGDVGSTTGSGGVSPPILGVSIEKSFSMLQPSRNIRPTGRRSFRVERSSEIEVMLNNRPVRRMRVGPGEYDLDDLPLTAGNNNVQVLIRDDTGREEKVDFAILFDRSLLNPGVDEWSLDAGFLSTLQGDALAYDYGKPFVSASYRRGLLETLTGEAFLRGDSVTTNGGLSALMQTSIGLLSFTGGVSYYEANQIGLAGSADFTRSGDPNAGGPSQSWSLGVGIEGAGYREAGVQNGASEMPRMHLSSAYSQALGPSITGSVSGRYNFGGEGAEDSFNLGLSVSRALEGGITMSASATYASDRTTNSEDPFEGGLTVQGHLSFRLGASSHLGLGYDWTSQQTTAAIGTRAGNGAGSWSAEIEINHDSAAPETQADNSVEASFGYKGNRFEMSTSHGRDSAAINQLHHVHHAANFGTALVFADDKIAVGRPVRGSFALVNKHDSLKESRLRLSPTQDGEEAMSDLLGPAVISDISAYSQTRLAYDIDNPPSGYDLGTGAFDVFAPYKGGYQLTVGSGFTVTAVGSLRDATGQPVKLLSGAAYAKQQPDRKIPIFTNEEGRFGAQGLGPGEWIIELADDAATHYSFSLPSEATGLLNLGDLRPSS